MISMFQSMLFQGCFASFDWISRPMVNGVSCHQFGSPSDPLEVSTLTATGCTLGHRDWLQVPDLEDYWGAHRIVTCDAPARSLAHFFKIHSDSTSIRQTSLLICKLENHPVGSKQTIPGKGDHLPNLQLLLCDVFLHFKVFWVNFSVSGNVKRFLDISAGSDEVFSSVAMSS